MRSFPRPRARVWLGLLALSACEKQAASPHPAPVPSGASRVLLAAGDVADCASDGDEATAAQIEKLEGTVLMLGDSTYPLGTRESFAQCYAPSWGRFKDRTRPVPGNHDTAVEAAAPYFEYFGAAAGEPGKGYYSFELAGWHLVALNSELWGEALLEQARWLREDLAAHPARCTLAFMHRPLFTSMVGRDNSSVRPLWEALSAAGADVVVTGHDHFYERWAPQTPGGEVDPEHGLREFVVGTGGRSHYPLQAAPANSEARVGGTFGVLKLTLEEGAYGWEFLAAEGGVADQGRGTCH